MNEGRKFTIEQVAGDHSRKLWHVSKKNIAFVGISDPESATAEVADFVSVLGLFTSNTVRDQYLRELNSHQSTVSNSGMHEARVDILSGILFINLSKQILEDKPEDTERRFRHLTIRRNLTSVLAALREKRFHNPDLNKDPFVTDLTAGQKLKVDIDGEEKEVEVKAPCPAPLIAKQLYWDLNRILEAPMSESEEG